MTLFTKFDWKWLLCLIDTNILMLEIETTEDRLNTAAGYISQTSLIAKQIQPASHHKTWPGALHAGI